MTYIRFFVFSALISIISFTAFAQTPTVTSEASGPGFEVTDPVRGLRLTMPNALWNINSTKYAISITHNTYLEIYISLKKSWYAVTSAQEAYNQRRLSLKTYLPSALFVKENEQLTIGSAQAVSMTYTNPSEKMVVREIMFVHRGVPYELSFTVKEENFDAVKQDFSQLLQKLQLI